MMNELEIYVSKSSKMMLPECTKSAEKNSLLVATFNRNLENLGFTLSDRLMKAMVNLDAVQINKLYDALIPVVRKMVGANKKFEPMYPNFPKQVMDMSEFELYTNAILHYWGDYVSDVLKVPTRVLPNYPKKDREKLDKDDCVKLKMIDLGDEKDFNAVFTRLLASNGSLSENDKNIVSWFVENRDVNKSLPESIPQKENLCHFVGTSLKAKKGVDYTPYLTTATDVLRVVVSLSSGDVSLAKPMKFRRLKRNERVFVLNALSNVKTSLVEDMNRHREVWKRVARELHPSDYRRQFPEVVSALELICSNSNIETFNSRVESYLTNNKSKEILESCVARPGDFTRRLDKILRTFGETSESVLTAFASVVDKVSTPVLLQAYNHFKNRNALDYRVFFPKGSVAKMQVQEGKLPELDKTVCATIADTIRTSLVKRFAKLDSLGSVYIDPALKDCVVPFSQRSASKTLKTLARGSKMPLEPMNVVRFFCWWKDGESRTDIDLSASLYDKGWSKITDVAYYNLKEFGGTHSGDITSAPNGASEFIDLDLNVLRTRGVRYIQMQLYSYTQQSYIELPECFAGWMARKKADSGEVYEPRTVANKVDITADTTVALPLVIDIVENKVIWTDISMKSRNAINNGRSNSKNVNLTAKAMCELKKANLYDLFEMHAEGRGEIVESKEKAETVFSLDSGITPYDIDKILSLYLV